MANGKKIRQFTLVQFEKNPRTGEHIADLLEIASNLNKYKSFTNWAYCIHDKDLYTQDAIDDMNYTLSLEAKQAGLKDESAVNAYMADNAWCKLGDVKGKHIHIVVKTSNAMPIDQIARFLGVPEFLIKTVKGKGAFLDCVQYLTHEKEEQQKLGKHRYDDLEVIASASCLHWREELNRRKVDEEKYGVGKSLKEKYIIDVARYGVTLSQCCRELDPDIYVCMLKRLQQARHEYITRYAPLPNTRISVYVFGDGGVGKDVFCDLLSHFLYPDFLDIRDVLFGAGDAGSVFDGYDGQPVVTFSDVRASTFVSSVGRRSVLTILDPHPKLQAGNVNVKFGNVKLLHSYNLINGIENIHKFVTGLSMAYFDKSGVAHGSEAANKEQFYRRIPVVVHILPHSIKIFLNRGIFSGSRDFSHYVLYREISGNLAKLQAACGSDRETLCKAAAPIFTHVILALSHLKDKLDKSAVSGSDLESVLSSMHFGEILKNGCTLDAEGENNETN